MSSTLGYLEHVVKWQVRKLRLKRQPNFAQIVLFFIKQDTIDYLSGLLRRLDLSNEMYQRIYDILNRKFIDLDGSVVKVIKEGEWDGANIWGQFDETAMVLIFGNNVMMMDNGDVESRIPMVRGYGSLCGYNFFEYNMYDKSCDLLKNINDGKLIYSHECGRVLCDFNELDEDDYCINLDAKDVVGVDLDKEKGYVCKKCGWTGVFDVNVDLKALLNS
jgi:hypothetical protein